MTNANLTLVIDALNNSTSALRSLKGDLQGIEAQSKKTATSVGALDTLSKRVFTLAAVRIGAQGIQNALKGLVNMTEAAQVQARAATQLNAVLASTAGAAGVTAEAATNLATEFQKSTRFMDEQVLSAENLLLTFTNIKDDIFPQTTAAVLDLSTALGQDLQSSAIQIGKALNNPIAGVTALQRVGVSFTEQQKDQIKTLVESGHALEAQRIILAELNKEFGGSATAMTPFERGLDNLKDKVADLKEGIGRALLPTLLAAFDELSGLGDGFSTNGVEASLLRIQIAILKIVIAVEEALDKINSLGQPIADALNFANAQSTSLAKRLGNLIGTRHDAPQAQQPQFADPVFGPETPLTGTAALLKTLQDQLQNLGADATGATGPVKGLRTDIDDLGGAAKSTGDKIKDFLSALSGAASDLFSGDTREQIALKLQKLQLGDDVSQFMGGVTGATGTAAARFADQQKNAQAQLDAQKKAIEQQLADLDRQHEMMKLQLAAANNLTLSEAQLRGRFEILRDITSTVTRSIAGVGTLMDGAFRDSLTKIIEAAKSLGVGGLPGGIPSHASGLSYVPSNNYLANLHKGEAVLTAGENKALGSLGGGLSDLGGGIYSGLGKLSGSIDKQSDIMQAVLNSVRSLKDVAIGGTVGNQGRIYRRTGPGDSDFELIGGGGGSGSAMTTGSGGGGKTGGNVGGFTAITVNVSKMTINGTGSRRDLDRLLGGLA